MSILLTKVVIFCEKTKHCHSIAKQIPYLCSRIKRMTQYGKCFEYIAGCVGHRQ